MTKAKTGGREAGTPNKLTQELKIILKDIVARELENLEENLKNLDPKERLEIVVKLLPFVMPKAKKPESVWDID